MIARPIQPTTPANNRAIARSQVPRKKFIIEDMLEELAIDAQLHAVMWRWLSGESNDHEVNAPTSCRNHAYVRLDRIRNQIQPALQPVKIGV